MAVRPGTVVKALIGLAAIAGAAWVLAVTRPRAFDGEAWIASKFDESPLPFDLRVASAASLPTGERTVILEPPGLEPEPPAPAFEPPKPGEGGGPEKPFDWGTVPLGEPGELPRQVVLAWYPPSTAEEQIGKLFRHVEWRDLRDLGDGGGRFPVEAGKLDWGGYDAPFVHLRVYEPGGTFRESIRVNLSAGEDRCAIHVLWPRGSRGSKDQVVAILRTLAPRVKPGAAAG